MSMIYVDMDNRPVEFGFAEKMDSAPSFRASSLANQAGFLLQVLGSWDY